MKTVVSRKKKQHRGRDVEGKKESAYLFRLSLELTSKDPFEKEHV